jgi:hypothetical protein
VLRWLLFEAAKTSARACAPDHRYYTDIKQRYDASRAVAGPAYRPSSRPHSHRARRRHFHRHHHRRDTIIVHSGHSVTRPGMWDVDGTPPSRWGHQRGQLLPTHCQTAPPPGIPGAADGLERLSGRTPRAGVTPSIIMSPGTTKNSCLKAISKSGCLSPAPEQRPMTGHTDLKEPPLLAEDTPTPSPSSSHPAWRPIIRRRPTASRAPFG